MTEAPHPPERDRAVIRAIESGNLYKFTRARWAIQNLERRRVKLTTYEELNDPFEFRFLPDESTEDDIRAYFESNLSRLQTQIGQEVSLAESLRAGSPVLERILKSKDSLITYLRETVQNKSLVLSLSGTLTNELLWSYYADGHKGIAVCYAPEIVSEDIYEVHYSDDPPVVNVWREMEKQLFHVLATKKTKWGHEEEFRWIGLRESALVTTEGAQCFVSVSPACVRRVVIGARCSPAHMERVQAILTEEEYAHVQLLQLRLPDSDSHDLKCVEWRHSQ